MFEFFKKPVEELGKSVLEPVGRWIMARSWPVRAAVLALTGGVGLVAYAPSYYAGLAGEARSYWTARSAGSRIALDPAHRAALDRAIGTLKTAGQGDVARPTDKDATAWAMAQSVVAVVAAGQTVPNVAAVTDFIGRSARAGCYCWTELPSETPEASVLFIGGWVADAYAGMGVALAASDVDTILATQDGAGWWPMFRAIPGREGASTYTTAWLLLGLAQQRAKGLIPADRRGVVDAAIGRAALWLASTRDPRSRWQSFPYLAGSPISDSISGLAIHALHVAGTPDTMQVDGDWLNALPTADLEPASLETYYTMLGGDGAQATIDHFAQVRMPWTIIATVDAFAHGGTVQRGHALQWLDARTEPAMLAKVDKVATLWWRAELLIGLTYLRAHS